MQEHSVDGKPWLVIDLGGDGQRYGDDRVPGPDRQPLGVHGDPVVVLRDEVHRARKMQRVTEFGGHRTVDRAHSATHPGVLRASGVGDDEHGSTTGPHLMQRPQQ